MSYIDYMNKAAVIVVAIVVLALIGGGVWYANQSMESTITPTPLIPQNDTSATESSEQTMSEVKEFTVEGASLKFTPNTIRVNVGDRVKINFKNTGSQGMHDFVIDEFDVATEVLGSGEEEQVEFVANRAGTFEFYCSVEDHREMGMVGTLVVE